MQGLRYKLYKNKNTKHLQERLQIAGQMWNHVVALQKRYYRLYGGYINTNKMQKHIAKVRNKTPNWKKLSSQSMQEVCQRNDKAYKRFFQGLAKRPPKFKKSKDFSSFVFKTSGYNVFDTGVFEIRGVCKFKFKCTRQFSNVKRVTVKKDNVGDWFISLTCDMEPEKYKRVGDTTIGIDFGLKTYLTTSQGEEIESPRFYRQYERRIAKLNRELSRKKKGSKGRSKAKSNLAKAHRKLSNLRDNDQWQLAHYLCENHKMICLEDLDIKSMQQRWGKKVSDLAFSKFVTKLDHVAQKYGTEIIKVDRYFPSSKLCTCGVKNEDLKLSDRTWTCGSCNTTHDRDLLAANNILTEGIRLYQSNCKTSA